MYKPEKHNQGWKQVWWSQLAHSQRKGCASRLESEPKQITKGLFPSFIAPFKALLQEESDLPRMHTSHGFDPNAYKFMKKSDYDFNKPTSLGHVIEAKSYGLNGTQQIIQS